MKICYNKLIIQEGGVYMGDNITKEEQVLKEFLLDIQCLDDLEQVDTFNFFDVLKVSQMEIRHSNVISWLLDPNENHGFGKKILATLNSFIARMFCVNDTPTSFKLLTMNYDDILLYREWQNIDILVESNKFKYVLCIENKFGSQEHDDQLNRYYNIIESKYGKEYTKIYLYLTPEGNPPVNDNNGVWNPIKYEALIAIIENEMRKTTLEHRRKEFIQSYVDILRRETMEDTKIIEICQEIYRKHKDALDLIYEHRPDRLQNLFEILKEWCKNKHDNCEIIFVENKSSKSYCRFRTARMDEVIKDSSSVSGWGTNNHYFYEICTYTEKSGVIKYWLQLAFSAQNLNQQEREFLESIDELFGNKKIKENWQWRTVYKTKTILVNDMNMDLNKEEIYKNLNDGLKEVFKNEEKILSKKS